MKRTLSRRKLLLFGALGASAAAAAYSGGWYWFKVREGDTEELIVSILRRHLKGIPVEERHFHDYARSVQERYQDQRRLAMLGMLGPLYERVDVIALMPASSVPFRRFEDAVVGEFLMSTDYFRERADEREPLLYFGRYDPYVALCSNPLARFGEES